MANESQLERFQKLKEQEAELKNQYIQLQTEAKLKKEEWDQALVEMKENYGVESFERLTRNFENKNFKKMKKYLKNMKKKLKKIEKLLNKH